MISPLVGLALWAVLFRRLASAPTSVRLVSTIGLWVALPPLVALVFGRGDRLDRPNAVFEPPHQYEVLGVGIDSNDVAVIVVAALAALLLTLLLRATPFGLSIRATVEAPAGGGGGRADTERGWGGGGGRAAAAAARRGGGGGDVLKN